MSDGQFLGRRARLPLATSSLHGAVESEKISPYSYSSSRLLLFPGNGLENALAKSRVNGQAVSFTHSSPMPSPCLGAHMLLQGQRALYKRQSTGWTGSCPAPSQPFPCSCPHLLPSDCLLFIRLYFHVLQPPPCFSPDLQGSPFPAFLFISSCLVDPAIPVEQDGHLQPSSSGFTLPLSRATFLVISSSLQLPHLRMEPNHCKAIS